MKMFADRDIFLTYHFDCNKITIDLANTSMDRSKTSFTNLFIELIVLDCVSFALASF